VDDAATLLVALSLIVVGIAAAISGVYIVYVYSQRDGDSLYLRRLVIRDLLVAFVPWLTDFLVIYGFLVYAYPETFSPLPRPIGSLVIGVTLVVLRWGVISDALRFREDRRIGRNDAASKAVAETD
jgi:hypothetical protein